MIESTPSSSRPQPESSSSYLYARSRYRGKFTPENLIFNANLQEFAQTVSYICALETSGKMTPSAAYEQVKQLWHQLDLSKQELDVTDENL